MYNSILGCHKLFKQGLALSPMDSARIIHKQLDQWIPPGVHSAPLRSKWSRIGLASPLALLGFPGSHLTSHLFIQTRGSCQRPRLTNPFISTIVVTAFIFPASRPTLASDAFFSPPYRSSFLTNQFIISIVPPPCHAVIEYDDSYSPSLKMHGKLMKLRLLLPAFDRVGQTNGLLWGRRDQTQPSQPFLFFPR